MGKTKLFVYLISKYMTDAGQRRKRGGARRYSFRGLELDELLKLNQDSLFQLFTSRIRRKLNRSKGFKGKYQKLLEKLRNSKKNLPDGEKPEMIGSIVGVYTGKEYKPVEVKFDMIGKYLGEFAMTYNPTLHNRPSGKKGKK